MKAAGLGRFFADLQTDFNLLLCTLHYTQTLGNVLC